MSIENKIKTKSGKSNKVEIKEEWKSQGDREI